MFKISAIIFIYLICITSASVLPENKLNNDNNEILVKYSKSYSNSLCDLHINKIITGFQNREKWALSVIDSWGKLPSGIFWRHLTELGNYDECMEFTKYFNDSDSTMKGQYCLANVQIKNFPSILSNENFSKNRKKRFIPIIPNNNSTNFRIGICIPNTCHPNYAERKISQYIENNNNSVLQGITVKIPENNCQQRNDFDDIKFRIIDKVAIILYSILAGIVLVSSIYDYVMDAENKYQIATTFSIITNGKKLFRIRKAFSGSDSIDCLNGIRCLSLIWVIFGHSYIFGISSIVNLASVFKWTQTAYSMVIQSATLSVDSFFVLSGLLVAWVSLKEFEKGDWRVKIPIMYLRRYIRLTPVLGLTILFVLSIAQYIGSGPFWNILYEYAKDGCGKWWWSSLLYVQNYVNPENICLQHSWYLSIDTQLFLISPLLLIPLQKWGIKFIWVPILLALGSISATFAISYINNFELLYLSPTTPDKFKLIYNRTHTRLSPWIVGLLVGYYLHLNRNKKISIPWYFVLIGWIGSLTIFGATVFGYYDRLPPNPPAPIIEGAFYESFSRVSWAIALAWVIVACHKGYGFVFNDLLSLPIWQPLSRLSYCMYIFHYVIEILVIGNIKTESYFSNFDVIFTFYSLFVLSLFISILGTLLIESPIIALENWLFDKLCIKNSKSESKELILNDETDKLNDKSHEELEHVFEGRSTLNENTVETNPSGHEETQSREVI